MMHICKALKLSNFCIIAYFRVHSRWVVNLGNWIVSKYRLEKLLACPMNSSKPIKVLLLSSFEPEEIEVLTDPYNSIPLKLLTIIIYIIELWASMIMLIFVSYEKKGLFGHYRTVINQLLSFGYGAVSYK